MVSNLSGRDPVIQLQINFLKVEFFSKGPENILDKDGTYNLNAGSGYFAVSSSRRPLSWLY